jgi:eukaryotic-like serine/threonine-protein kinase
MSTPAGNADAASSARVPSGVPEGRPFGRFRLLRLLGRSTRSMAWLAQDPRDAQDCVLMLPRAPTASAQDLQRTLARLRRAAKAAHPHILAPREAGVHEMWPYLVYPWPAGTMTVGEFLTTRRPPPPLDCTAWCIDALEGLACAHETGVLHGDIGLHSLLIDKSGKLKIWGLGLVSSPSSAPVAAAQPTSADLLPTHQVNGQIDTLCVGLLLHMWLTHGKILGEADLPTLCAKIESEVVRLPFSLPQAVPDALRAISNRSTDRHEQRRYVSARSLLRALQGWRQSQLDDRGGVLAMLSDRLHRVGHLPARPGIAQRVSRVTRMESQRLDTLADIIVQDTALSLELLRTVNSVQFSAPGRANTMTTVRRAIALVGMVGLRRAAGALKAWPGPLTSDAAQALERGLKRACWAGLLAAELSPAGLDAEAALLAAQMQHLGRLLALYHFPEEAEQIEMLVQEPTPVPGETHPVGMQEDAAAMAVLGVDLKALASALAKHWGMDDVMQTVMRPLPRERSVFTPHEMPDWLRTVASCANETLSALSLPAPLQAKALSTVAQRYVKVFAYSVDELRQAAIKAEAQLREGEYQVKGAGHFAEARVA